MISISQSINECLYLQKKEKNEIILNNCQLLKQHQIDGLRFLFRQFKKKKPTTVINFPPKCGKSVTVVLFLSALKNIINKPILILCNTKSEINVWNEIILNWTEYTADDIAIESTNVYIKKKIFIKHLEDLTAYQRRSWSMLIIKDDINKSTLKLVFDADFRIWLTSTDVKRDLKMLSLAYNWLTKSTMDAKDFVPSGKTLKEKIQKRVLLDSFLEDFLMQETRVEPFKIQIHIPPAIDNNEICSLKKSRKNKDASGTKIKRSKIIIVDNDYVNDRQNQLKVDINDHSQKMKAQNENNDDKDENSESLLQNYENLTGNTHMDVDGGTEQFSFGNAIHDIVETENVPSNKSTESMDFDEIANTMNNNDCSNEINDKSNINVSLLDNEDNDACQRKGETTVGEDCLVKYKNYESNSVYFIQNENMNKCEHEELDDTLVKNDIVLQSNNINETGTGLKVKCHKDIDAKLSELEEKALKKYKGSLLDSIF